LGTIMERTTFFEHYRICNQYDGAPAEISRTGPAIVNKASDLRSGAPVALTLIPIASVDPAARDRFEEQARAADKLDHINISKIVAFGIVDDQFAFVSEYPQGGTVDSWIAEHGPMPPDAVLRVTLQVVSALSAGSFHGLTHPAIQPSNLMIVPERTAEGGWPFVKLMNFGLAGLKLAPGENEMVSEFASPEQLQQGTTDFRSEIYSLGATMCFLLTGAFYSAEPRSLQTRRFAKPLRKLIAPMLCQNPDERPQDPVLFAQAVRVALVQVERRQALAQKFGIPFLPVVARPPRKLATLPVEKMPEEPAVRPRVWPQRRAWAFAALALALVGLAAVLFPAPVSMILHRNRDNTALGVPIGVPDNSPAPVTQNAHPTGGAATTNSPTVSNAMASVQGVGPASNPIPTNPSPAVAAANQNASPATRPSAAVIGQASLSASPIVVASEPSASRARVMAAAEAPPQPAPSAEGPQTVWERAAGSSAQPKLSTKKANAEKDVASNASEEESSEESKNQPSSSGSKARTKSKEVASRRTWATTSDQGRNAQVPADQEDHAYQPPYQPYQTNRIARSRRSLPPGSFRAQFVGRTPEGNLILRLPSGEIAIVPPPGRGRRIWVERPRFAIPPPQYAPMYPPGEFRD
jgi:serine/threonine protein kinase